MNTQWNLLVAGVLICGCKMALPKNKSRPLKIDDDSYRWMVRPTANQLVLTVQHDSNGQPLQSTFNKLNYCRKDAGSNWVFEKQGRSVTPAVVRIIVETAIHEGWDPRAGGSAPYVFDAIVWRIQNRDDQLRAANIDTVLDPPIRDRMTTDSLLPVPQLAQDACEDLIHHLAWPTKFRRSVFELDLDDSLPIPEDWVLADAKAIGLTFKAAIADTEPETGYVHLAITCDQYSDAEAILVLYW